eukprot:15452283-Alexandrium_andersonii.AAC.1
MRCKRGWTRAFEVELCPRHAVQAWPTERGRPKLERRGPKPCRTVRPPPPGQPEGPPSRMTVKPTTVGGTLQAFEAWAARTGRTPHGPLTSARRFPYSLRRAEGP